VRCNELRWLPVATLLLLLSACGDTDVFIFASFNGGSSQSGGRSGQSSQSSGNLMVRIADSRPVLPPGTEQVIVSVEEVLIHAEGGEWISLPLVAAPFAVDLLELHSGTTGELAGPASIREGTYDRIRLVLSKASVISQGGIHEIALPPEGLTIEREFALYLEEDSFNDLTIDFDLSQSLFPMGDPHAPSYVLSPVLHINHTHEAAIIRGEIAPETFEEHDAGEVVVTVFRDTDFSGGLTPDDEEYTRVRVEKESPHISIHWLVPQEGYIVTVDVDGKQPAESEQFLFPADLPKAGVAQLNQGNPI